MTDLKILLVVLLILIISKTSNVTKNAQKREYKLKSSNTERIWKTTIRPQTTKIQTQIESEMSFYNSFKKYSTKLRTYSDSNKLKYKREISIDNHNTTRNLKISILERSTKYTGYFTTSNYTSSDHSFTRSNLTSETTKNNTTEFNEAPSTESFVFVRESNSTDDVINTTTDTSTPTTESTPSSSSNNLSSTTTEWSGTSTAEPIPSDILCPKDLTYLSPNIHPWYCYHIIELGKYDNAICPYSGNIFNESVYLEISLDSNKTSWITAKRNDSFSPYVLQYSNTFDVLDINDTISYTNEHSDNNCLIYEYDRIGLKGFFKPVDCNSLHYMLCLYDFSVYDSHCYLKNHSWRPSDINSEICYQLTYSNYEESNKLAEPIKFYQYRRLYEIVEVEGKEEMCQVGIQNIDNKLIFTSSKNEVEYADYIEFDGSGSDGYISKNGTLFFPDFEDFYKGYSEAEYPTAPEEGEDDDYGLPLDFNKFHRNNNLFCSILEFKNNITEENVNILLTFNDKYIIGTIINTKNIYGSRLYCKFGDKMFIKYANQTIDLEERTQFNVEPYFYYPHSFWCQAVHVKTNAIIESNSVLVYNNAYYGKDYIINVLFENLENETVLNEKIKLTIIKIDEHLNSINTNYISDSIRVLKINKTDYNNFNVNFHISTKNSDTNRAEEMKIFNNTLSQILENYTIINSLYCLEEQEINNKIVLFWPETLIGSTVTPNSNSVCVTSSYGPVTRKCVGDFVTGAKWTTTKGQCSPNSATEITNELHNISQITGSSSVIGNKLNEVTTKMINNNNISEKIHSIDIDYVAKILLKITINMTNDDYTNTMFGDIYDTVSNIIKIDRNILNESQAQLNSTDNILFSFDQFLLQICNSSMNCNSNTSDLNEIDIRVSNLDKVVGWKVLSNYTIIALTKGTTIEEILQSTEEFVIASFVPNDILQQIEENKTSSILIMTFFYNDNLFNEVDTNIHSDKIVLGILLTNFSSIFNVSLPIIYNSQNSSVRNRNCVFWKYGFNDNLEAINGTWAKNPGSSSNSTPQFQICNYTHLTHFGMLVNADNIDELSQIILNIVTIVGTSLSASGIAIIFLTAALFKKWRNVKFNITQLNFLLSTIFTTIGLFLADYVPSGPLCKLIGIFLHYAVISQFCWMLIMSYLAYKKYVIVFNVHIRKLKEKTYFLGWIVPIIPIIIVASIDVGKYDRSNESSLCYLNDLYFKIGILLPIFLILTINVALYVLIILSLTVLKPLQKIHQGEKSKILRLISILTFQMGLIWIFGFVLTFYDNLVVSYIFAIGCSIQGFIISLGHFLMGQTKRYWMESIKNKLNRDSATTNSSSYKNTNE